MAEIICPMCSKSNPPEAEVCQYCQARLTPLVQPPVPPPAGDEQVVDWLRDLRDEGVLGDSQPPSAPIEPVLPQPPAEPAEEMPDWLARIRQKTQEEGAVSPIGPAPVIGEPQSGAEEELPEWMRDLTLTGGDASSVPGWMQPSAPVGSEQTEPVGEQPFEEAGSEQPAAVPAEMDNDAWLRSLGDWAEQSADRSQAIEPETPSAEPEKQTFENKPSETETVEWAQPESQGAVEAPESTPAAEPEHTSFGITGWLRALDGQGEQAATPQETPQTSADSDWLNTFGASAPEPVEPAAEPQEVQASEQNADWLSDFGTQPGAAEAAEPSAPQDAPDWMSAFEKESAVEEVPPVAAFEGDGEAQPADGLSEWLQAIDTQQPAAGTPAFAGIESAEPVSPFTGEEEHAWVSSSELPPSDQESYELPAFTVETSQRGAASEGADLAEWSAEQTPVEEQIPEEEGIEPAQLPTWLQAMRPLDASVQQGAASQERVIIEKSGPLAGISGVLPGEEIVTQYRKPQVYSARLKVSEKQQALAALLETVVAEEPLAQTLKGEATRAHHVVIRLVVALLLMAVIIFGLLVRPLIGISTGQIAPGTGTSQVSRSIGELAEGAPVLVVIDYEAGLSGELEAASVPVLQHLMSRKARIVLVSTQPVGAVLGEGLLKAASDPQRGGVSGYVTSQSTANLGYLVGGAIALRELAAPMGAAAPRPLQQALPSPFRAEKGWDGIVLKSLSQVTDFKRVVLLTDSVENGRAWIEQVQPALQGKTPLLVVSSAQAAPLLQPYQASGQVSGLIAGLVGGRAYEEIQRRPAVAGAYWNAYLMGLGLALLLVLSGGIVMAASALFRRGKKRNQAGG